MRKIKIVITDIQLKRQRGGGQFVVKELINGLKEKYHLTYIGQDLGFYYDKVISPYKIRFKPTGYVQNNFLLKTAFVKKLIRTVFHNVIFLRNGLFKKGELSCDIVISNSEYDGAILSPHSRFKLKYRAAIFVKHNPYFNFNRVYPDKFISDKDYRIVALNSADYKRLKARYPPSKVNLIYNGIRLHKNLEKHIEENAFGISRHNRVILSVGRLEDEQKNFSAVIKLMPQILKLDPRVIYIIAGSGPDEVYYKKLIKKLGLSSSVKLVGFISDEEKTRLMQRANLLLQPSVRENFSIVTLEAMALGMLVGAAKNEGSFDIIKDGENGFFIDFNNSSSAEKIVRLLSLKNTMVKSIKAAAVASAKKFSIKKMIKVYKDLIETLYKATKPKHVN